LFTKIAGNVTLTYEVSKDLWNQPLRSQGYLLISLDGKLIALFAVKNVLYKVIQETPDVQNLSC